MSSLEAKKIAPATGTTVTLGAAGDTVDVSATALKTNTIKDAGGNTLFTSDGAGTLSSVNSAFKGGLIFISSQTASGSASIEFTTGLTSAYNEYVFFFTNINPATDEGYFGFQCNATDTADFNDIAITSSAFRAYHNEADTQAVLTYNADADQAQGTAFQRLSDATGSGADEHLVGELHIFNPSSTTYVKNFIGLTQTYQSGNMASHQYCAGYLNDTTAVDDIQFKFASGNFDGKIKMWGVK